MEDNDEIEFQNAMDMLNDDMTLPSMDVDPKLVELQKEIIEFVTSVILKHEADFYELVNKHFTGKLESILGTTNPSIISMITETTNKFYNKLYYDIQHGKQTDLTKLVLKMCELAEYGAHILLDKLIRLTIEAHLEVNREKLAFKDYDIFSKTVLNQINIYLLSKNLFHIFSKGLDEDTEFINIPEGNVAFNIVIDKNIKN